MYCSGRIQRAVSAQVRGREGVLQCTRQGCRSTLDLDHQEDPMLWLIWLIRSGAVWRRWLRAAHRRLRWAPGARRNDLRAYRLCQMLINNSVRILPGIVLIRPSPTLYTQGRPRCVARHAPQCRVGEGRLQAYPGAGRHIQGRPRCVARHAAQGPFYPGISQFNGGISHRVSERWD